MSESSYWLQNRPLCLEYSRWRPFTFGADSEKFLNWKKSWFWWNWKHSNCCRWNQKRYFWAHKCNLHRGMCSPLTFLNRLEQTGPQSLGNQGKRVTMVHGSLSMNNREYSCEIGVLIGCSWAEVINCSLSLYFSYTEYESRIQTIPIHNRELYRKKYVQNPKHRGSL